MGLALLKKPKRWAFPWTARTWRAVGRCPWAKRYKALPRSLPKLNSASLACFKA